MIWPRGSHTFRVIAPLITDQCDWALGDKCSVISEYKDSKLGSANTVKIDFCGVAVHVYSLSTKNDMQV